MTTRPRATKQYQALINAGLTRDQADAVLGLTPAAVDPRLQGLLDAGFSSEEATRILSGQFATPAPVVQAVQVPVQAAPPVVTSKDLADALVAQSGLAHGKGRVYATGQILEAAARVLKGGKPEVVATSGKGKTPAVVIFREDSGDVAIQNLYNPVG